MKLKSLVIALCLIMGSQIAKAQVKVADMVKEWERSKAYTKEYLDAMPENKYALKPTPDIRSFAEQLLHLADGNYGFASYATNAKSPYAQAELEKSNDKSKTNVSKLVLASYDFVIDNMKNMSEAQLDESFKLFGKFDMTRRMALAKVFEHQAHHRGQATVYIRLAGVTPPQEKLF